MKAIFFSIPASGHVNPSLALTTELVKRGDQIIFYDTESFRAKIEATGAAFRPYAQLDDGWLERNGLDGSNPSRAAHLMTQLTRTMLPDLLAVTRAEAPDYILYDSMCPWGALVGRILGLPTVSSTALLIFNGLDLIRSVGMLTFLPTVVKGLPDMMAFRRLSSALGREYHVPPLTFVDFFNAPGDLIISYTVPPIQPDADTLDPRIQFVGTSITPRGDIGDFPLERLDGKTVIYISLGTVINDNPTFFETCLQAFTDSPYTVVMSIGQKVRPQTLGTIPPNFIVRPYNPQLEILQRSALFITHAGMNSVHEGLFYGVPLLLVPQQQEETFVAQQIEKLGAGLRLHGETSADLHAAAERVLNDSGYRQNAAQLGEALRKAGGALRAADLVQAMVREHTAH